MRGYAMLKIGESGWIEKDVPACGPRDAIVKPLAVAICTSDVHTLWEGAIGERHNMILGHESCGEIAEIGEEVADFKPGDRVLVPAITPDWSSLAAQAGFAMHSGGMLGGWKFSNFKDGVFSEFYHVNDADGNLAHLPENIDPVDACMLSDMVPTGFHAAELADVEFGDVVLVIGIGPVGLMSVAGAAMRGAAHIIAVGNRPVTVEVARRYGADDFISYKNGPIAEQVLELTGGVPVDKVLVAGGDGTTFEEAVKCVRPGGKIGNVNYLGSGEFVTIPRVEWGVGMGHKEIIGGLMPGGRLRMEKLGALVARGRLDVHPLISHIFEGWDHLEEALFLMRDKPADLIKPVVRIEE
ncbi:Alcohol dehydrogenase zinc-binding domain protein [Coriobacterium glomerans PW2]|uniref:Alcohol dehydrogenase zinc-binding domain protein n=1 Tax=Coriobacterium glomerans (strain ATCC 49209 / DSM 20642 / JCM 10262 / PW2) TaxID=700015 RepID=F2NAS8_CORGP|nr:NAD(P)-dependent alcohol dehydrogenase [Coriobacterium glomerans]AEB07534.1 Alcohol dehydrogenase zinc-binding domain protein [Coriobacterium glomerans PW2]